MIRGWLLLVVCLGVAHACPASIWSPQLPSRLLESSPQKQCGEITNEYECKALNLCCYQNNACIPSNANFIECPSAKSQSECDLRGGSSCWFDGTDCRRSCPYTTNVDMLCLVLGTLSNQRTASPTLVVTLAPTPLPTMRPTLMPTSRPTLKSTLQPTLKPTKLATFLPTKRPTLTPTKRPTLAPIVKVVTSAPTKRPTLAPTAKVATSAPTKRPTLVPTAKLTTLKPTPISTLEPSPSSTLEPSPTATFSPSRTPTFSRPTTSPKAPSSPSEPNTSLGPTPFATLKPTSMTTAPTTLVPASTTTAPTTLVPTSKPTIMPPTKAPTNRPTAKPAALPTPPSTMPVSKQPTTRPSKKPTLQPTKKPTKRPTTRPSKRPTKQPTSRPTKRPTDEPTAKPTNKPALTTVRPTSKQPTAKPTKRPTLRPTKKPTKRPTLRPTKKPVKQPTPKAVPTANTNSLSWYPGLKSERNPTMACRNMQTELACARNNYCCWQDAQCFPPSEVAGVECPLITDATVCGEVWSDNCKWANNVCQRIVPTAVTPTKSANQWCVELQSGHELTTQTRFKSFDSLVTTSNETLQAETSSAVNSDNQYCWNKASKSACQFPFTYQGNTYNDCVSVVGKGSQCITVKAKTMQTCTCTAKQRKRSVLLISLDDFRPEMNLAYGRKSALTPVLDRFTKRPGTVVMDRAYTQFSWCSPSRDSYLSGLLPDTTKSYSFAGNGLRDNPNRQKMKTLPELFKDAGYYTAGGGKVFHLNRDDPQSWNEYYSPNVGQNNACQTDSKAVKFKLLDGSNSGLGCITSNYQNILDTPVLNGAINVLERIVQQEQEPFFVAVGLFKPHMPYHVHNTFWSKFSTQAMMPETHEDMSKMGPPAPKSSYTVNLTFDVTVSEFGKVWGASAPFEDKSQSKDKMFFRSLMRRGYQAAVYQTDDMIGQLLNKLDALALRQSTLVIIHGDHGFALGENNAFAKQTNFEIAVRVPILIHVPWYRELGLTPPSSTEDALVGDASSLPFAQREDVGAALRRNNEFFDLLDLMPTVAGIMQVGKPKYYEGVDQSGQIALAAMGRPTSALTSTKEASFSQMMRCSLEDCTLALLKDVSAMGYSVRTSNWRYTAYLSAPKGVVQWDSPPLSQELYDHTDDSNTLLAYDNADTGAVYSQLEMTNFAPDFPDICAKMFQMLIDKYNHKSIFA
ncbi:hypothetical protein BASA81_002168 [Batrachochytrium salamandrivorans]|nr:hypothetical protein BASA81_002168 [Batrachochytrium salamandrivorans]